MRGVVRALGRGLSIVTPTGWALLTLVALSVLVGLTLHWSEAATITAASLVVIVIAAVRVAWRPPHIVAIDITNEHIVAGQSTVGQLTVTTGPGGTGNPFLSAWLTDSSVLLANSRGETGGIEAIGASSGLTLLADGQRVYPADYLPPDIDRHRPLTEQTLTSALKEGATTTVCVVWPDTGQDTVTLDHPGHKNNLSYVFRLTDIPVITA